MTPPPLHIRTSDHIFNRHAYICELVGRGIL
jgi:hypothetical protein